MADVLNLKSIELTSLDDKSDVRIKTIDDTSAITDKQSFKVISDPHPYWKQKYRIKAVNDDDTESKWITKEAVSDDINPDKGINEYRIKGISIHGNSSAYVTEVAFVGDAQDLLDHLLLEYCFDVMDNYMNDYLTEIFLEKELFDKLPKETIVQNIEQTMYTLFPDFEDKLDYGIEEMVDLVLEDTIGIEELCSTDFLQDAIAQMLFELGPDKFATNFDGLINSFVEQLIETNLHNMHHNFSDQVNVVLDDEEKNKFVIDYIDKVVSKEISKAFIEFKTNDIAHISMIEMITDVLIRYYANEELNLEVDEDIVKVNTPVKNSSNEEFCDLDFKELTKAYKDLTQSLVEVFNLESEENVGVIWEAFIEDLFRAEIRDGLGYTDIELKLFDEDFVTYKGYNQTSLIMYENGVPRLCLSEYILEDIVNSKLNEVGLEINKSIISKDKVAQQLTLYDVLNYIRIYKPKEFISISFLDEILVKNNFISSNLTEVIDTKIIDNSNTHYSLFAKDRPMNIKDKAEDLSYVDLNVAVSPVDKVSFELKGNEQIGVEFGDFGMPDDSTSEEMGLGAIGYMPLGSS